MSSQPLTREAAARVAGLFDDHGRLVLGICRVMLPPAEAEDAAQQTFVSAHRALIGGVEPCHEAAWLATIARNECRRRLRHVAVAPVPTDDVDRVASDERDPAALAVFHAQLGELRSAIADLPERQREALLLRDFYGLAYEDVAAAMSVSVASVESLLVRARRSLKASLGEIPRLAGALSVPATLRDGVSAGLSELAPEDASAAAAATGGAAGLAAKLISLPFGAKLATASVATLALGAGVGQQALVERQQAVPPRTEAAAEPSGAGSHARTHATTAGSGQRAALGASRAARRTEPAHAAPRPRPDGKAQARRGPTPDVRAGSDRPAPPPAVTPPAAAPPPASPPAPPSSTSSGPPPPPPAPAPAVDASPAGPSESGSSGSGSSGSGSDSSGSGSSGPDGSAPSSRSGPSGSDGSSEYALELHESDEPEEPAD